MEYGLEALDESGFVSDLAACILGRLLCPVMSVNNSHRLYALELKRTSRAPREKSLA